MTARSFWEQYGSTLDVSACLNVSLVDQRTFVTPLYRNEKTLDIVEGCRDLSNDDADKSEWRRRELNPRPAMFQ